MSSQNEHTTSHVRGVNPSQLTLSTGEQSNMVKSIQEIFELEEDSGSAGQDEEIEDADEDVEPVVDLEDQQRRTERLKAVLGTMAQLWWADSDHMDIAAEKRADGSRDPKWRIPIGDSGVLDFFLEILRAHTLRDSLKIHVLRLIGNSCADTDENRARVVASNSISSIVIQLGHTQFLPFAIPVLYNILMEYELAQQQASQNWLSRELITLISSPRFQDHHAFLGYVCKILDFLIAQPTEPENAPDETSIVLLKIAADRERPVDMEDFVSLVNTAVLYLTHEKFQRALITQGGLDIALSVLVDSYTRFDSHPAISPSTADEDDAKALSQMRSNLNQVLSDVSALPEFKQAVPITSSFSASLRRWLSSPQLQLQVCACIMLGNLARSDEACIEFIHVSKVHVPLISVLSTANDSQLLHAALGFLKNLALPLQNKAIIAAYGATDAGIFDVLPRLWMLDTLQQIQFSAVSLARQLVIGTYSNLHLITRRLSPDPDSPANNRSKLSLLIALFDRTDVEPIKMEIARLVTAVCRTTVTAEDDPSNFRTSAEDSRKRFLKMHPDFARPLGFMVSQTKWPVVRSEGWFAFALMARVPEGAQVISDMMQDVAVFQPLVELLTGKNMIDYQPSTYSSPNMENSPQSGSDTLLGSSDAPTSSPAAEKDRADPKAAEMQRIDRENAMVMVSELLKNHGDGMAIMRRTLFEELLQGGGELVLSYKERGGALMPGHKKLPGGFRMGEVLEQAHTELS